MTTAGPNNASSFANNASVGTLNWSSPLNVGVSDNVYASVQTGGAGASISKYLLVSGFGFAIPSGAVIDGITINVECKHVVNDGSGITTYRGRIVKAGTIGTTNKSITWGPSEGVHTLGGASDLWGETWTPADINHADTGFAIAVNVDDGGGPSDVAYIDHITMTVDYSGGSSGPWACAQQTYAARLATNIVDTGYAWTSKDSARKPDAGLATCPINGAVETDGDILALSDFGLSIPSDATITGIKALVKRYSETGTYVKDKMLRLMVGGVAAGDDKASASVWSSGLVFGNYGGAADMWGLSLTPSQVNASDFGIMFQIQNTSAFTLSGYLDSITLMVYFTVPSDTGPEEGLGMEFLRPTSAINNDWNDMAATAIDDDVVRPDGGDGTLAFGDAFIAQPVWGMSAPTIDYPLLRVKVWVLASVEAGGSADMQIIRIRLNGNWYTSGEFFVALTDDPVWYCVEFLDLEEVAIGSSPAVEVFFHTSSSDNAQVDALYFEMHYDAPAYVGGGNGFFHWF